MVYAHFGFECDVPKCEIVDSLCSICTINAMVERTLGGSVNKEEFETRRCNFVRRWRRATVSRAERTQAPYEFLWSLSSSSSNGGRDSVNSASC